MPTTKTYLASDSLLGEAIITDIMEDGRIVRIDRTLFHPQGGGQRADAGMIGGIQVLSVKHAMDGEVDHHLAGSQFEIGQMVAMQVDEAVRRENARYHSAGHLIADAVASLETGLFAVQGHHWPGEARVEFEGGAGDTEPSADTVQAVVDQFISERLEFCIVGDPFASRALKIGDFQAVGCGGTHVKSSADLAGLTIGSVKRRKGRLRIGYSF